jgi:hypothetical protein
MTAVEPISDSVPYTEGITAAMVAEPVVCPYDPGSRLAQLWYDGYQDGMNATSLPQFDWD